MLYKKKEAKKANKQVAGFVELHWEGSRKDK